jgi:hypothetical protein
VVRDLFTWFADEGQHVYALQSRLKQLGIASPQGRQPWSTSTLHGVLTNPTYLGQVFAQRARTRPAQGRRSALLPGRPQRLGKGRARCSRRVDPSRTGACHHHPSAVRPRSGAAGL